VGAGPAGEVAAGRLVQAGLEVAIAEEHLVGGECAYYACMPSKALLRPGELLAESRRIPGAAEAVTGTLSVPSVLERRDQIIHHLEDAAQLPWLEDRGIALLRGAARLVGERELEVGGQRVQARRAVVVATGSSAFLPPIPGLAESRPWTNRKITTADEAPERLIMMGGGVVGVEMSQAWQSLGSQVTLIEAGERLIAREEAFASELVTEALADLGVDVRTRNRVERVERSGATVSVTLTDGSTVEGDELVVAVGRRPRLAELGLDAIGLDGTEPLETDVHLRVTGLPWLYAIGDVNGRALYTHMGKYQGRVAADHLLGQPSATAHGADGARAPRVIFTDPQVAGVGHTTASATDAGLDVIVADVQTSGNAGGSFFGRGAPGITRLLADRARGVLVGATFTGAEVAEMLHAATIAIVAEVPLERLAHAVPAFPTRTELWLQALDELAAARAK
jgi:dihydrolipoamide dehydrogenase